VITAVIGKNSDTIGRYSIAAKPASRQLIEKKRRRSLRYGIMMLDRTTKIKTIV
jgi:hypothetical protein